MYVYVYIIYICIYINVYIYIYIYVYITKNLLIIFALLLFLESNVSGSFLQTRINFLEQRVTYSHFESSIIP